jgi:hypothetical protein
MGMLYHGGLEETLNYLSSSSVVMKNHSLLLLLFELPVTVFDFVPIYIHSETVCDYLPLFGQRECGIETSKF